MRLIKSSFEILEQEPEEVGIKKLIEKAKRVCYKSEDKITEDSYIQAVQDLIDRKHGAMLEHGTVYLCIECDIHSYENHIIKFYKENPYSVVNIRWSTSSRHSYGVTTNYRVLVENNRLSDLKYQCEPIEDHERRVTVKFICDRGVSHEFVRHRVFSFAQESTRYCNYSKNKFGNDCTFIIPCWLDETDLREEFGDLSKLSYNNDINIFQLSEWNDAANFLQSIAWSEANYLTLLDNGWTPQQARSVLPNSLKTELVMTGTIEQWKGFFELRCANNAHPQARELAIPLEQEFISHGYINK